MCQIRVRCMMSHAHCGRFGPGPCSGFGAVPGVSSLSIARHDSGLRSSLVARKTKCRYNHREGLSGATSAAHRLRKDNLHNVANTHYILLIPVIEKQFLS